MEMADSQPKVPKPKHSQRVLPPLGPSRHTKSRDCNPPLQVCATCDSVIQDKDDNCASDDAVYCEGQCQALLHRKCLGMSKKFYIALGEIDEPYFCPNCCVFAYKKEIESIKATVASLSEELSLMQDKLANLQHSNDGSPDTNTASLSVAKEISHLPVNHPSESILPCGILPGERKFHVIINSIKECPQKTARHLRHKTELDNV